MLEGMAKAAAHRHNADFVWWTVLWSSTMSVCSALDDDSLSLRQQKLEKQVRKESLFSSLFSCLPSSLFFSSPSYSLSPPICLSCCLLPVSLFNYSVSLSLHSPLSLSLSLPSYFSSPKFLAGCLFASVIWLTASVKMPPLSALGDEHQDMHLQ